MDENLTQIFIKNLSNRGDIYIRGLNKFIKDLAKNAKNKNLPIYKLENNLNIKKHTFYMWYTQGFPLNKLNSLNQLYLQIIGKNLPASNLIFGGGKGSKFNIKIPKKLNKELAYLVSYLYGDGTLYLSKKISRIEFYDSSTDFLFKIADIILKKFNLKPKLIKDKRKNKAYSLRYNSKILLLFFNILFETPIGKKKELRIPNLIKNSKYVKDFITGFFDAEGHIYYTPKYGYRITLTQNDKNFLEEIKKELINLGLSNITIVDYHRNGIYELRINRKENFYKFINIFNDLKHPNKTSRIKLALQGKSTVKNPKS